MEVCLDEIDMLLLKGYCVANEVEMLGAGSLPRLARGPPLRPFHSPFIMGLREKA